MLKVMEKLMWLMLIKQNMGVVAAGAERKVLIRLGSKPEPPDKKR